MTLLADTKSHFSLGESLLSPEELAQSAATAGYAAAALCDTMTIAAMPDFTRACEAAGIKPLIAVRVRVVDRLENDKKLPTYYPKLFALTQTGLKIIMKLLTLANDEEHFHYVPRLLMSDVLHALDGADGHVAFSTGTLYSATRHADYIDMLKAVGGRLRRAHTLCEVVPAHSAVWDRQALLAYEAAAELDLPILLSRPSLFADDGGSENLKYLGAIVSNSKQRRGDSFKAWTDDYKVMSPAQLMTLAAQQFKRLGANAGMSVSPKLLRHARLSWTQLAEDTAYRWQKMEISLPKMAEDEDAALREMVKKGMAQRFRGAVFGDTPRDHAAYVERLRYEMGVLTGMGFSGYFLLTHEIVSWAKGNGIVVGPGRGSAGGSLVAYALGITDIDPIRFGLIFERFLNPERLDLPDIDIDFMSTRRHEVIEHIEKTYGTENVAGVSNYLMMGSKMALSSMCRINELGFEDQMLSKSIPEEGQTGIPLEEAAEQVPALAEFAKRQPITWRTSVELAGKMKSLGRHASAVVVAGEPIVNRAVIERRASLPTVNWDKNVVEDMGLIKMDILGLKTLDLLSIAHRKIAQRHGVEVDLTAIPLDDERVLRGFGEARTTGIFQYEGGAARRLLKNLYRGSGGAITFEDLAAASALNRPGPIESGLLDDFVAVKSGEATEFYEHPAMQPALSETYSVIVYQEQVMQVARDLCGFTMAQADHLRKAIGKKDPVKMAAQGEAFVAGAIGNGMAETAAQELWDKIVMFAGYAFNKSHAAAYALISYQSMYLKTYYPIEWFAGALSILGDDKMQGLLKDASHHELAVTAPEANVSGDEFEVLDDKTLVAPFNVVKGLSEKGAKAILEARADGPFRDLGDFTARVPGRSVNVTVRSKLDRVGAFCRIEPGQLPATDPSRREDQLEFTPTIVAGGAIVTRDLHRDRASRAAVAEMIERFRDGASAEVREAVMVNPRMGRNARFMVVQDGPNWAEEQAGRFTEGKAFEPVDEALAQAGLDVSDAYWTALSKVPKKKGEKLYGIEVLDEFKPLLLAEIEALNPQVILVLGSNAARVFTSIKGGLLDHTGKVIYQKATDGLKNDRNIVLGIAPGMVYFDASKQQQLNEAFQIVAEMLP